MNELDRKSVVSVNRRGNHFNFKQKLSRADGELDGGDVEEEDDKEEDDGDSSQSDGIEANEDTSEEDEWK